MNNDEWWCHQTSMTKGKQKEFEALSETNFSKLIIYEPGMTCIAQHTYAVNCGIDTYHFLLLF